MKYISERIGEIVSELYGHDHDVILTSPDPSFGDYSTNIALQITKTVGQSPRDIAQAIADKLPNDIVSSAEVAGPGFINVRVTSKYLQSALSQAIQVSPHGQYGAQTIGDGRVVLCEYPSPNMAKPFSVGHIRSGLQGWAMYKLMSLMGYKVITDNHVGDSGTPFGKWVVGFLRYSSDEQLNKDGINELSRIYIAITSELKAEKEAGQSTIADEVQSWLVRLEKNDPEATAYSERFNTVSFEHLHYIMQRLHISTEFELGESFFVARGQQMADELLERGIAEESEGAVIVRLDEYGIDSPIMLRKANGTSLYATTDLATIEYREKTWSPEHSFIHTGQEQAFYFRQLNALAEKAGFKPVIKHLWHGLVDVKNEAGEREKMSSRKGVILLEDLLNYSIGKAKEYAKDGDDTDVEKIALAAVKFADFMADRKNGVLFDWDSMFSVHGFSGPAVQYAAVRIQSILAKTDSSEDLSADYDWQAEHALLLQLHAFPDLLLELHGSYEMHKLASYLYNTARETNRYYENTPILNGDPKFIPHRAWLLRQVHSVLKTGLDILGIEIPTKM